MPLNCLTSLLNCSSSLIRKLLPLVLVWLLLFGSYSIQRLLEMLIFQLLLLMRLIGNWTWSLRCLTRQSTASMRAPSCWTSKVATMREISLAIVMTLWYRSRSILRGMFWNRCHARQRRTRLWRIRSLWKSESLVNVKIFLGDLGDVKCYFLLFWVYLNWKLPLQIIDFNCIRFISGACWFQLHIPIYVCFLLRILAFFSLGYFILHKLNDIALLKLLGICLKLN